MEKCRKKWGKARGKQAATYIMASPRKDWPGGTVFCEEMVKICFYKKWI